MVVIVFAYRVKVGEEDAIIALHEDWQRNQNSQVRATLSWELLQGVDNPRQFVDIAHFPSKESVQATTSELRREGWYDRLESLTEEGQAPTDYISVWTIN